MVGTAVFAVVGPEVGVGTEGAAVVGVAGAVVAAVLAVVAAVLAAAAVVDVAVAADVRYSRVAP